MKNLMMEERFGMIRQADKDFIVAFTDEMSRLGYGYNGKIGDGFCWGRYMILYTKTGVKNKNVLARIYIREDGIVLRLYFNKIDEHRQYVEHAPSHIKNVFTGEFGKCNHCRNEKDGNCKFRKTYTIDGSVLEKCNGMTFEFREPDVGKLPDYLELIREFIAGSRKCSLHGGLADGHGGNALKRSEFLMSIIVVTLCFLTTISFAEEFPPADVLSGSVISVVIPLQYDPIESINGDLFVTNKDLFGYTLKPMKNLYNFAGDLLLEGMQDISFSGNWIIVRTGGKYGVYSHELVNLVPCLYSRVVMTDETHCEVIDGTLSVRPGIWYGNRYRYDLTTGVIVSELGYGAEAFPSWGLDSPEKRLADMAGSAGITLVKTGGIGNKSGIEAGAAFKAYNGFGQMLLDFGPYCGSGFNALSFGSAGRLFYGYADDGNASQGAPNYVFSGRGRLIAWQRGAGYQGMYGGDYICAYGNTVYGTKPFLLDWNGDTVIAGGIYDGYQYNNDGIWTPISDNPSHVIVSKDGMYGVIILADSVPKPSSWAQAEVAKAVQKGLVPDDVKVWWKDSCTRLEFCRMLALTLQEITGSSVVELSAGTTAAGFEDCNEPDVLAAAALGIAKGIGNDRFAPYSFITREQAAVMLARTAVILNIQAGGTEIAFADRSQFPEWSVAEIEAVSSILCGTGRTPLMQGSGNNLFSPGRYATVEQVAAAMSRLTKAIR